MNNLVYIIIAVIILAAIIIFFLRGSKKKPPSQPVEVEPPTPIEQTESEPVPAPIPETDYLLNAQDYINEQRYDDAISELKTGLKNKPNDSGMMLKLLNVYAITNRRSDFDNLYNDVESNSDSATKQQAQSLLSMLNEEAEQAQAEAESPVETAEVDTQQDDMSLDFSSSTEEPVEDALSFDEIEDQLLENDADSTSPTDNSGLEFSTDELSTDTQLEESLEPSFDDSTESLVEDDATITLEELDDSISGAESDDSLDQFSLSSETPTQELDFKDVDSNIQDNVLSFDEIDSNAEFSELDLETETADTETASELDVQENDTSSDLSFDELQADLETETEESPTTSDLPLQEEVAEVEPDLDMDSEEAPTTDLAGEDDTYAQLDALSDENMLGAATDVESDQVEQSDAIDLTESTDDAVSDDAQEALLESDQVSAPVIDDSEFMKSFEFVQDLDNSQITLDLAQQYLELGEYDSAKRLVSEVMDGDSSDEQKTVAQDILARMN